MRQPDLTHDLRLDFPDNSRMKYITKTILFLSLISLLTDIASEMLYPIMPMYLREIGFSVLLIGILEGIAEATAGLSKGYFGKLSDHSGKRKPFVQIGYSLSAVSKPMMALFTYPLWIFAARTTDRLGKGVRTAARDAMLSDETSPEFKGRVFGFHRGFDTLGAAIGPGLALMFLTLHPDDYRPLFLIAFIPGFLATFTTFLIKEKRANELATPVVTNSSPRFFAFLSYWKTAPREFRNLLAGLLVFALVNSSDFFLLLMLKNNGASDQNVILVYIAYNLVFALASFPIGAIGDKIGLKVTFLIGLFFFTVVYVGIVFTKTLPTMVFLFCIYGLYAASTDGIAKAWISNIVPGHETATAIGFYTGMNSVVALLASSIAGLIWFSGSPELMFEFSAAGTILIIVYFLTAVSSPAR